MWSHHILKDPDGGTLWRQVKYYARAGRQTQWRWKMKRYEASRRGRDKREKSVLERQEASEGDALHTLLGLGYLG